MGVCRKLFTSDRPVRRRYRSGHSGPGRDVHQLFDATLENRQVLGRLADIQWQPGSTRAIPVLHAVLANHGASGNVQQAEMIATLERYISEFDGILARFTKSHDSIDIRPTDESRLREIVLELRDLFVDNFSDGTRHASPLLAYFEDSLSNFFGSPSYRGVDNMKGVVVAALARLRSNPLALRVALVEAKSLGGKDPDFVVVLAERLHTVVRQLRERREGRPTLDVSDEYDVQDLLHALLTLHFDDIRKEEWAPSYAGGGSRMDFLLPEIEAVVEAKMTRSNLTTRQLGEQLIVDIAKYKTHPTCRTLFCVVYDPTGRLANPRGVESDLNDFTSEMKVRVLIVPR
jgi:hypothetical protein